VIDDGNRSLRDWQVVCGDEVRVSSHRADLNRIKGLLDCHADPLNFDDADLNFHDDTLKCHDAALRRRSAAESRVCAALSRACAVLDRDAAALGFDDADLTCR
jgi:hypothetical protein